MTKQAKKRIRHNKERLQKFVCPCCERFIERKVDIRYVKDVPYCWECERGMIEVGFNE